MVKRELNLKANLSIYWLIYVPTLSYGHKLWVVTERMRSQIQAPEMSFLCNVTGLALRDRVVSSGWEESAGQDQDTLEGLSIPSGLGMSWDLLGRAGESDQGEEHLGYLA